MNTKVRAAQLSVLSNLTLTVLKVVAGLMICSVSVLAEAFHSAVDLIASGVALFSVKQADKPADEDHRFGHGKIECLSGMIEAALIFAAAGYIIYEAVQKFRCNHFEVQDLGIGVAVMGFSAVANFFVSRYLYKVASETDSMALEADALHLKTDVYTSAGVFAALVVIKVTGYSILDPAIAFIVGLFIVKEAAELTHNAIREIIDTRLPKEEEETIKEVIEGQSDKVIDFHKLRTRKVGSVRHIDFHIVVSRMITIEEGHALSHLIEDAIVSLFPNSQVLVHTEPCEEHNCPACKIKCISV